MLTLGRQVVGQLHDVTLGVRLARLTPSGSGSVRVLQRRGHGEGGACRQHDGSERKLGWGSKEGLSSCAEFTSYGRWRQAASSCGWACASSKARGLQRTLVVGQAHQAALAHVWRRRLVGGHACARVGAALRPGLAAVHCATLERAGRACRGACRGRAGSHAQYDKGRNVRREDMLRFCRSATDHQGTTSIRLASCMARVDFMSHCGHWTR